MKNLSKHKDPPMMPLSVQIPDELEHRLEALSQATGRTDASLVADALGRYLAQEEWQMQSIRSAVTRADRGEAAYASHEAVDAWLASWGTDREGDAPRCE